jgi:hypothetical protein
LETLLDFRKIRHFAQPGCAHARKRCARLAVAHAQIEASANAATAALRRCSSGSRTANANMSSGRGQR